MWLDFSLNHLFAADVAGWSANSVRIEKEIVLPAPLYEWLPFRADTDQFFFRDRRGRYEIGALGQARLYAGRSPERLMAEIEGLWRENRRFRLFGGMSFFNESASPEWEGFGCFRFVLPLIEIETREGKSRIILNLVPGPNADIDADRKKVECQLRHLDKACGKEAAGPLPGKFCETLLPGHAGWEEMIARAQAELQRGDACKVVLARKKILKSSIPWDPVALFRRLVTVDEDSFLFFCQLPNQRAFLGRSPERLFRMEGKSLTSDAIAGTRPRGLCPEEDSRLEREMLISGKELEEHRLVVDYILEQMRRMCTNVEAPHTEEPLKLKHLQHIITRIHGEMRNGHHPLEVALSLHPTPAVGGVPSDISREVIMGLEPFKRGWYAAPVGWITADAGEFAVGIRSALVAGEELHLFGGAGIIRQSTAEAEWLETGSKMENFIRLLGAF